MKISRILENKDYLVSAIKDSNVESVRLLLKNGADTKIWGEKGENALHLASLNAKTTDIIDVVLETDKKNSNINRGDNDGLTPLYWAIATNNLETIRHLIQKGADPIVANKDGSTPLHAAVYHVKSIETVSLLLGNKQVDINRSDKNGMTALHYTIHAMEIEQSNNVEMVCYLLEKGADPTIRNNNGSTPFHLSTIFLTNTDVLGLMLENETIKIDIDEKKNDGLTALHIAIGKSNLTTARFLLSKGANPNIVDGDGRTPLHVAALLAKDMDMVKLLVNHPDVDVNYLDNKGYNALVYAMGNTYGLGEEIANLLREKGAVLKEEGNKHEPENIATLVDSFMENIRYLLEKGQDTTTTKGAITEGENGANALHLTATIEKITKLTDSLQETNLYARPTASKCTSYADNNDNVVKEVHHSIQRRT